MYLSPYYNIGHVRHYYVKLFNTWKLTITSAGLLANLLKVKRISSEEEQTIYRKKKKNTLIVCHFTTEMEEFYTLAILHIVI